VSGQACSHTEVKATIERAKAWIKAAKLAQGGGVHKHPDLTDGKHIAEAVILSLVPFTLRERHALAETSHRFAHFANHTGLVAHTLLRSSNFDERCTVNNPAEPLQR
jgi:hypothetical protein